MRGIGGDEKKLTFLVLQFFVWLGYITLATCR